MFRLFSKEDDPTLKERIIELEKMLRAQASVIQCIESQVLSIMREVKELKEAKLKKRVRKVKDERDKDIK